MLEDMARRRPWLTPCEQVAQLKDKGVTFSLWSESDAVDYLREHNNYFRVRSYRSNFPKCVGGKNDGKYAGLDFGMLVDIAIIDMKLRNIFLDLTIDIEHYSKIRLLDALEREGEDGYEVVKAFLEKNGSTKDASNPIVNEIKRGLSAPYTRGIIEYHPDNDYAVWELFELISFGCFTHFYEFCATRLKSKKLKDDYYLLQPVRCLRNACAHNSCILNDMRAGSATYRTQYAVERALAQIGIQKDARQSKLGNERMQHIATTLYMHQAVSALTVRAHRASELQGLANRTLKHADWYRPNSVVSSGFVFLRALINGWYGEENIV